MLKKLFLAAGMLFSCVMIFARDGILSGTKGDLKTIVTKYFDIIYPEESELSAMKIASVCDGYYEEIAGKLNTKTNYRFPVTITPAVEQLNAYYTAIPYNRIVLYDTKPDHSLDMYQETLCSVFYHELTHAVTWNMKSTFWRGMSHVFGDIMNPGWLTTPTFWSEGATVSFESAGEGGRLNDPFATQLAGSYKIDDKFPGWRDVTGARDTYPGGNDAYIFGGLFARYLQEKYGIDKYGDFWRKTGSLSTVNLSFKSVYGKSISSVWEEFEKTVYCPENVKNTETVSNELSYITCMGHSYNNAPAFVEAGADWSQVVYFDSKSSGVYMIDKGKAPEKLLTITGVFNIQLELNKIIMRRYIDRDNVKEQLVIYNLENGKTDYAEPQELKSRFITENVVYLDESHYCQLYKDALTWKLMYKSGDIEKQFDFSKVTGKNSLVIHNLNWEKCQGTESYIFTWAELGKGNEMMSRIGRLVIDQDTHQGKLFLEKDDDFAGVTDIAFDGRDYYAVLQRRQSMPLVKVKLDDSLFDEYEIAQTDYKWLDYYAESENNAYQFDKSDFKIKSYNPFSYVLKGTLIPLGTANVYSPDFEDDFTCALGVTYLTSNPWGDKLLTLTGGYHPGWNTASFAGNLQGGNDSLQYIVSGQFAFIPQEKWKQSIETLTVNKTVHAGRVSSVGFNLDGKLYNEWEETSAGNYRHEAAGDLKSGLFWSTMHKNRPEVFYNSGFTIMPFIDFQRDWLYVQNSGEELQNYINAGITATVRFPLIFPWTVSASLYPEKNVFASGTVSAVLFDFEIQKGIPCTAMYINRLYLTSGYGAKFDYSSGNWFDLRRTDVIASDLTSDDFADVVSVSLNATFEPNFGFFANGDLQLVVSYKFNYYPHEKSNDERIKYGLTCSIAY